MGVSVPIIDAYRFMPKVNKINKLPEYRVVQVALEQCEIAPFYPMPEISEETDHLLREQLHSTPQGITPFWGVIRDGLAQIFLGGYQVNELKRRNPKLLIKLRIGVEAPFSAAEMARLMLYPGNGFPEADRVFHARVIEGLKQSFALSDQNLAAYTGISRPAIANMRRLLKLHPEVLLAAQQGKVSYTIARELLSVAQSKQQELVREFGLRVLSNQNMLDRIRGSEPQVQAEQGQPLEPTKKAEKDSDTLRYEEMVSEAMGYPVEINSAGAGRGQLVFSPFDEAGAAHIAQQIPNEVFRNKARLVLEYDSFDELDGMLATLFPPEDDF